LLHCAELTAMTITNCASVEPQLSRLSNGYSKRNGCSTHLTRDMVLSAMRRAKELDQDREAIPIVPSSQVYLIMEELLRRESIELA